VNSVVAFCAIVNPFATRRRESYLPKVLAMSENEAFDIYRYAAPNGTLVGNIEKGYCRYGEISWLFAGVQLLWSMEVDAMPLIWNEGSTLQCETRSGFMQHNGRARHYRLFWLKLYVTNVMRRNWASINLKNINELAWLRLFG
jgi:hypothetical protein